MILRPKVCNCVIKRVIQISAIKQELELDSCPETGN